MVKCFVGFTLNSRYLTTQPNVNQNCTLNWSRPSGLVVFCLCHRTFLPSCALQLNLIGHSTDRSFNQTWYILLLEGLHLVKILLTLVSIQLLYKHKCEKLYKHQCRLKYLCGHFAAWCMWSAYKEKPRGGSVHNKYASSTHVLFSVWVRYHWSWTCVIPIGERFSQNHLNC